MTDRPILFSGPMVRALLREIERPGTGKTQTRRRLEQGQFHRDCVEVCRYSEDDPTLVQRHGMDGSICGKVDVRYHAGDRLIPCVEIYGFDGMYAAGVDGNIYSFAKGEVRKLKAYVPEGKGYPSISLLLPNGKTSRRSLHRVICEAFYGRPPSPDHECRVLDGDRTNSRPGNLAWGTREEVWLDRRARGRGQDGEKHHAAKFSDIERSHIRWAVEHGLTSTRAASRILGVSQAAIWAMCQPVGAPADYAEPSDRIPSFYLLVTDVRVQPLLNISEDDARAEGFTDGPIGDPIAETDIGDGWTVSSPGGYASAAGHFQVYWAQLYPDWDGFSSPWVAAYTFRPILGNIDQVRS